MFGRNLTGRGRSGGAGMGFRGNSPPYPYVGRGRGGLPRCQYPGVALSFRDAPVPTYATQTTREQELNSCLMQLLREEGINEEVRLKYEALLDFLQSPESERLRKESERYLAEGKQVSVRISINEGQPKYELIIK